jgi:hypothetical protein
LSDHRLPSTEHLSLGALEHFRECLPQLLQTPDLVFRRLLGR